MFEVMLQMYENLFCSSFCKYKEQCSKSDGPCLLTEAVEDMKREYAIKILSGEEYNNAE